VSATLNLQLQNSGSLSLVGPASVTLNLPTGDPFSPFTNDVTLNRYVQGLPALQRSTNTNNLHGGLTVNGDLKKWRWSFTGNYDRVITDTVTDNGPDLTDMQALLNAKSASFNPFGTLPTALINNARPSDLAHSISSVGQVNGLLQGPLFKMPAGNVNTSLRIGFTGTDFSSSSYRTGISQSGDVSRDDANGQFNINIPLTSKRNKFLDALGDFTLNGNVAVNHLSDFGTLARYGGGLFWSAIPSKIFINTSYSHQEGAPSPSQLGDPVVVTPNVRTYDYVRGETVNVTTVTGGNPTLTPDHRDVWSAGVNLRPFTKTDFNFNASYTNTVIHDAISAFPAPTAEIEAAFPQRFLRDENGQLIRTDSRPVNFDRTRNEQMRWGFNLTLPLPSSQAKKIAAAIEARQKQIAEARAAGKPIPPPDPALLRNLPFANRFRQGQQDQGQQGQGQQGQGQQGQGQQGQSQQGQAQQGQGQLGQQAQGQGQAQQGQGQPAQQGGFFGGQQGGGFFGGGGPPPGGGGGGFGGPGGPGGGGGNPQAFLARLNSPNGPLAGRLMFSVFHTWTFRNDILIRPGVPILDLLNGSATGSNGGTPEHQVQVQAGYFKDGLGLRLTGNWQSGTHVDGGTTGSATTLNFSSLTTISTVAFVDLGRQAKLVRDHPFFRGARVSFSISNLFDQKMRVTDQNGLTPLSYQPDLVDPIGRSFRLSFRKLFF
jgi:hypothetical protein